MAQAFGASSLAPSGSDFGVYSQGLPVQVLRDYVRALYSFNVAKRTYRVRFAAAMMDIDIDRERSSEI